jgi:Reverse transcriptase (RNA-dependent DNA polymerase)
MSVKSNAIGIDGNPLKFIKLILPELLTTIMIIKTSSFPSLWKTGFKVPIPKGGRGSSQLPDFRPISVLPVLSKIMESFSRHLAVEKNSFSVAVLFDFSKAFDSMSHPLLFRKLKHNYGLHVSSVACRRIGSFLGGCRQRVVVNKETSSEKSVFSGSPLGNILSPILFACFINDIKDAVRHCRFHLYAVGLSNLNSDLEGIRQCRAEISPKLNANKTQGILFFRNDLSIGADPLKVGAKTVPYSDSVRNLGLFVDRR